MGKFPIKVLYVFIIGMLSCTSENTYFDASIDVDSQNIPLDSSQFYFPHEFFPKLDMTLHVDSVGNKIPTYEIVEDEYDLGQIHRYSMFLHHLKEPLLFNKPLKHETYRLTVLRTFHQPLVIRFTNSAGEYWLYWKSTNGHSGDPYQAGELNQSDSVLVSYDDWNNILSQLNNMDFREFQPAMKHSLDGSTWILEGATQSKYHVRVNFDPDTSNPLIELFNLAKDKSASG